MFSRLFRRRAGLALSGLLLFQGVAMPLGVCGQGHEHDEPSGVVPHDVMSEPTVSGGAAVGGGHAGHSMAASSGVAPETRSIPSHPASGARGPSPQSCVAMSGCGTPALAEATPSDLGEIHVLTDRPGRLDPDAPLAVDLGITTPPPKI
jgi:hypothetical protein